MVCKKICHQPPPSPNTVSFTDEEAKAILDTKTKLQRWMELLKRGVISSGEELKSAIMDVVSLANTLYSYYVPPFTVQTVPLSEQELQSVINDLKSKGGLVAWYRLDGNYHTTSFDDFKKIVGWDWTNLLKYETDTFDCENFAFYFAQKVMRIFGVNSVGVVLDYSSAHAYNLVIVKDQQGVRWYLYEPQTDEIFSYQERKQDLYKMQYYILLL